MGCHGQPMRFMWTRFKRLSIYPFLWLRIVCTCVCTYILSLLWTLATRTRTCDCVRTHVGELIDFVSVDRPVHNVASWCCTIDWAWIRITMYACVYGDLHCTSLHRDHARRELWLRNNGIKIVSITLSDLYAISRARSSGPFAETRPVINF